jgi:hypothetical protein
VSNTRLQMQGLTELITALRHLPEELTTDAADIVAGAAEHAQREVQTAYPEGPTGNLKRGVVREQNKSKFTTAAIVRSRAKHAWLFEKGSVQRQTATGANRGRMPEAPADKQMIPIVIRNRRRMVDQLKDLVRTAGFIVD